ncbi:MAG: response regulator [Proteobacteria bacterium]|nr:response regulator [Pseudomonadota bacterium]
MKPATCPRVLLVEDDPTSRAFLTAAAVRTPAETDSADCMSAALALADGEPYDLWLFDAQLPDGSGIELLRQLRERHADTPALAHTACSQPATHAALRAAGFADVVVKPLPAAAVQAAIRGVLGLAAAPEVIGPSPHEGPMPLWDDNAAALALNGNREHVRVLRGLFLQELAQAGTRIGEALRRGDVVEAQQDLHKLRASCGFVGASRLAAAARELELQPRQEELCERFTQALCATLGGHGERD